MKGSTPVIIALCARTRGGSSSVESPAGTLVTTAGPTINASATPGSAGSGNLIAITSGGQISYNGATIGGSGVTALYAIDHCVFQENSAGAWWGPITSTSTGPTSLTSPEPVISLSNNTVGPNSNSGTVVGTVSTTTGLANGTIGTGAYSWTYALSGSGASNFQMVGNSLQTAVRNLSGGPFAVTITATPSPAIIGGPLTLAVTITVTATETTNNTTISTIGPLIYASQSPGNADPSGPYDTWQMNTVAATSPATTNLVRNSSLSGATAGTPGTYPTNMSVSQGTNSLTVTTTYGIESATGLGLDAMTIQISGTPTQSTTFNLLFDTQCPASASTQYTLSVYYALAAGSTTNVGTIAINGDTYYGSTYEATPFNHNLTLTSTLTQYMVTATTAATTISYIQPYMAFNVTSGKAVNITIQIAGIQLQTGASATAFQATPLSNNMVVHNGVVDPTTSGTTSLTYSNHYVERLIGSNTWYYTGTAWAFGSAPTSSGSGPTRPSAIPSNWVVSFFDDFTSTSTIASSSSVTTAASKGGPNWYWYEVNSGQFSVNTTETAASVSNGNTGGGTNASSSGGILTLTGCTGTNNACFGTVPQSAQGSVVPPGNYTTQCWPAGCYIEFYYQFKGSGSSSSGWPALWSWGLPTSGAQFPVIEVDFLEVNGAGTQYGGTNGQTYGLTMHNWGSGFSNLGQAGSYWTTTPDSGWHTLGWYWQSNGTQTLYLDNSAVTAGESSIGTQSSQYQFIYIGTGTGWPINIDWVRVWVPPA